MQSSGTIGTENNSCVLMTGLSNHMPILTLQTLTCNIAESTLFNKYKLCVLLPTGLYPNGRIQNGCYYSIYQKNVDPGRIVQNLP